MRRYLPGVLAMLAPLVAGLAGAILFEQNILPNRLLVGTYEMSFSGIASRLGILLSLAIGGLVAMIWWAQHQIDQMRGMEHRAQIESRRRFLRRLDHELKNPLTIIRLGIVNMQNSSTLSPDHAGSLQRIGQQAERLQRLIVDLRWLAGLEEHTLDRSNVDLKTVLEEVVETTQAMPGYEGRAVELSVQQVPWPLSSVWGDRDLLIVVFRNLVENALKYSDPSDRVLVRASEDGQVAVVEIVDTGQGIPEEEIALIWEELYRGQNARGIPGSGLGLALVRRIVSLHGGSISVRSRLSQGTVMTVRLPLAVGRP